MYRKRTTVKKIITPSIMVIGGARIVGVISEAFGFYLDEETQYIISTGFYSLARGFINLVKHFKR